MSQPDAVTAQLSLIRGAVDYLADLEGQDRDLVLEMSQAMLGDVIEGRGLRPLAEYDADRIAAGI
jgi:hypothetical protein